jgi:hypothetical protein
MPPCRDEGLAAVVALHPDRRHDYGRAHSTPGARAGFLAVSPIKEIAAGIALRNHSFPERNFAVAATIFAVFSLLIR